MDSGDKITFFMPVISPVMIIADYAVKSYAKIRNIPFKLLVYSNWVSTELKQEYFPAWREFDFVKIEENNWQHDEDKPSDPTLDGPFEKHPTILDRELKKIGTPFFATVDADFEILDARFIDVMLKHLDVNPKIVAMGTDYVQPHNHFSRDSGKEVLLNGQLRPWFCIYKQEALNCTASHWYYEESVAGSERRTGWDTSGYFQKELKDAYGYQLAVLDPIYQPCFIHYNAFSLNRDINRSNIDLYRFFQIIKKRGILGKRNIFTRGFAYLGNRIFFRKVNRNWLG